MTSWRRLAVVRIVTLLAVVAIVVAACTTAASPSPPPGTATPTAASSATAVPSTAEGSCPNMPTDKITLSYWEFSGGYLSEAAVATLDKEFMAKYPNVTLSRTAKSLGDILTTEKLQMQGDNPPDIPVTNAGFALEGPLVQAKLIIPLDSYASQFGWDKRFGESALRAWRFSDDGKTYGDGSLYIAGPAAAYVGLYYNTEIMDRLNLKPPATYDDFKASLKTAKDAGVTPVSAGIQDGWPAIHMFTTWQDITVPTADIRNFVFHSGSASIDTPDNVAAATEAQAIAQAGNYTVDFQGKTVQSAIDDFVAGNALYFIQGTYFASPIATGLGDKARIMLFPGNPGGPFSVTGGSIGWGISAKSKNPDAAACYIDWRTGQRASDLYVAEGGLPSMQYDCSACSAFTKSVFDGWSQIVQKDALVPYIDWGATNLIDTLTSATQQLVGGQLAPADFTKQVQEQYTQFNP
jgi:raffinose/stachyose/melibiose transport system substrate-binding protein